MKLQRASPNEAFRIA